MEKIKELLRKIIESPPAAYFTDGTPVPGAGVIVSGELLSEIAAVLEGSE